MDDKFVQNIIQLLKKNGDKVWMIDQITDPENTITLNKIDPPQIDNIPIPEEYIPYYLDRILLNNKIVTLPVQVKFGDFYTLIPKESFVSSDLK